MGTLSDPIAVSDLQGQHSVALETQVDTGETYLVLSRSILARHGMDPTDQRPFRLVDGGRTVLPVGNILLHLDGENNPVPCVFAPQGAPPLLEAVSLETFELAVDPVGRRLVPAEGLLLFLGPRRSAP